MPTFAQLYDKHFTYYATTVDASTASTYDKSMRKYVLPRLADMPIDEILPAHVLDLHAKIAKVSPFTAHRSIQRINRIFDYAVTITGDLEYNKIARIGRYTAKPPTHGWRFVDLAHVPKMLKDIDKLKGVGDTIMRAFWLMVYTGLRRSEVVYARKDEFDLSNGLWTIPASRMKINSNGDHIVPLSEQAIKLIEPLLHANTHSDYVFVSPHAGTEIISTWSLYQVLVKAGYQHKQTLHGFRKIFSTHAHTSRLWTIDAIELTLSHKIGGVRGVYNHANMLDERCELLQWWANEVDKWRGVKR
ncbi:tyrosine-type recombinase/integrase [Moraxella catarrhalis]|uniref:tyrosine-type recombinase/integrase n=1 Tax=Moraxella catarrhalis TaxID=480 RepID=UPI0007E2F176|nr:tyrosine-type recombinase/integrase [Moraxella catarrhalis]OAV29458.1 Integrase [Moraxella catarrhalis]